MADMRTINNVEGTTPVRRPARLGRWETYSAFAAIYVLWIVADSRQGSLLGGTAAVVIFGFAAWGLTESLIALRSYIASRGES